MGKAFTVGGTIVVTAILVSAFWIFAYNIQNAPGGAGTRIDGRIETAGDKQVLTAPGRVPVQIAESIEVGPAGLAIPVVGIKPAQLVDTFDAARSGGRIHDAIDIMAGEGTPVIAAAPGQIEKLFNSVRGGNTIYIRSPDRKWIYYYAHLNRYAPGLAEGEQVQRGQVIAFVGHTGDASATGPHLHFAINQMGPGDGWWNGQPINPYPLLAGKVASR